MKLDKNAFGIQRKNSKRLSDKIVGLFDTEY